MLVVHDEPSFREALRVSLGAEGFAVEVAADGEVVRLRSRIEPDPSNPQRPGTIRGLGYKHCTPAST